MCSLHVLEKLMYIYFFFLSCPEKLIGNVLKLAVGTIIFAQHLVVTVQLMLGNSQLLVLHLHNKGRGILYEGST